MRARQPKLTAPPVMQRWWPALRTASVCASGRRWEVSCADLVLLMQAVAMFSPRVTDPELDACNNVTGVACSGDGRHVLGNYLNNHVYLFSVDGVGLGGTSARAPSPERSPGRARRDGPLGGAPFLSQPVLPRVSHLLTSLA